MDKQHDLVFRLSDGKFHSGESLALALGISRTAVWKRIRKLAEVELDVYSVRGKGYRLSQPIELLEPEKIRAALRNTGRPGIDHLEVLSVTNSTNLYLNQQLNKRSYHGLVVFAEYQRGGKGRRGNNWLSPYGSGICMSLGWHFPSTPASHTALSLATGVAVCRSLQRLEVKNIGLKWPNDIVYEGKKLGGILLESRSETAGSSDVIIGIGINVNLPKKTLNLIEQAAIDVNSIKASPISRNALAGILIDELFLMLNDYQEHGFKSAIDDWRALDALAGRQAELMLPNDTVHGGVMGIDENGLLLMSINGETRRFSSGELSLRVKV